jgi:hypothetical protein
MSLSIFRAMPALSLFLLASLAPVAAAQKDTRVAVEETAFGVIQRNTLTLKLRDGSTRNFQVKANVSLDYADDGDEVRVTVRDNVITSIKVTRQRK